MPGLGTSFGRGGATTFAADMQHADCILIMGSNMAECHPVAFRWVMKAKTRNQTPCTLIHADPRFTRTSALADMYLPIRSGTDIAFTGGLINYVLQNDVYFKEYVHAFTNATYLVHPDFADTEDLDGLFSGFDPEKGVYDTKTWKNELEESVDGKRPMPKKDPTLQHPRCALNVMKKHFARYTPEVVERICGTPREGYLNLCELVAKNGGRNPEYREEDGQRVMKKSEIAIRVLLGRGQADATIWTCDLSHDYVTINADYRS